ncbi:hypothetical protein GMRT_12359 [Giardia muris]|uniref:Uncharacterized protein n=1 Tax=Giardia muris TaxID=5742 RepID=A0A4Z1SQS3_GIAMU|nr:hypothetical protein GMRT_12359 [Giardia muris]|eukprot:TNJ27285.1 hypothetical protein GMRT_12359 [Giardia muris]
MTSRTQVLQRSHIKLVSYPHKVESEYHDEYIPRKCEYSKYSDPNLRQSHFSLSGTKDPKMGISEHQAEYRARPLDSQVAATNLHHLPDNIKLARDPNALTTDSVYMADYRPHGVPPSQPVAPGFQRSHFRIGADGIGTDRSIQQTDYVPHPVQEGAGQLLDTRTLQASHFPTTQAPFAGNFSETQDSYKPYLNGANYKELLARANDPGLRKSHIECGYDPAYPRTTETSDMLNQTAGKMGLKSDNMDPTALRQSHLPYPLNAPMLTTQTEQQASYQTYPNHHPLGLLRPDPGSSKAHVLNPLEGSASADLSETQAKYVPYDPTAVRGARGPESSLKSRIYGSTAPIVINDQNSQIQKESEFMAEYNRVPDGSQRSVLDGDAAARLRHSHLSERNSGPMASTTTTGDMLAQSKPYAGQKLIDAAEMGLRNSHITAGAPGAAFQGATEHNSNFIPRPDLRSQMADSTALRKSHFNVGLTGSKFEGETIYHSDYQPKPLEGNVWEYKEEEFAYL